MYERSIDIPTDRGSKRSYGRIVVYRSGALGDMITSFPVLENIRRAFPDSHVTLVGPPDVSKLALSSGYVDRTVSSDAAWIARWHNGDERAVFDALGRSDLFVLYAHDPENGLAETIRRASLCQVIVHPPSPPSDVKCHVTDFALRALAPLQVPIETAIPHIAVDAHVQDGHSQTRNEQPNLFVHPGSSSSVRIWPDLLDCAAEIARAHSLRLTVNRGPVEVERGVADLNSIDAHVVGPYDVSTLAAVISRASLYLGNDTGPTHLAAALGVPTIAVFGPKSNPVEWSPRGPRVRVVYKETRWPTRDEVYRVVEQLYR